MPGLCTSRVGGGRLFAFMHVCLCFTEDSRLINFFDFKGKEIIPVLTQILPQLFTAVHRKHTAQLCPIILQSCLIGDGDAWQMSKHSRVIGCIVCVYSN